MGLIILLRTGLSNGRDGEIRVRAPCLRGWRHCCFLLNRSWCSKECSFGAGQGESDSQPFHGFLHAFLNVQSTSQLWFAQSRPWGYRSGEVSKMQKKSSVSLVPYSYFLTCFSSNVKGNRYPLQCIQFREPHLPSCINLGMFHFCKNCAVIFAFLCMPFIWCSQCAVQMFHCQTRCPLICFEIPSSLQSL